jgi:hypothetical protein
MLARFHELEGLIVGGGRSGSSSVIVAVGVVFVIVEDGSEDEDARE